MNRFKLLFALSVALNVGFITLLVLHAASSRESQSDGLRESIPTLAAGPDESAETANADGEAPPATVQAYRRLYSALRATGLPEAEIRRILRGTALADWRDDIVQMQRDIPDGGPFWIGGSGRGVIDSEQNVAFHRRMVELRREREAALAGLTGDNVSLDPWQMFFGHDALPNLSSDEKRAVMMLEEDYRLLQMQIEARTALGIELPEDREAMRLLREERLEDLANFMSQEELEEYELRHSETSRMLRRELSFFNPTEEEFRNIFRLRREFEAESPSGSWEATQMRENRLREILGEERHSDYIRTRDREYQQLVSLAHRLDFPIERANEVYQLRALVERQERAIQFDQDLTHGERREGLQVLVEEAHDMIRAALGDQGYVAYTTGSGWWIRRMEQQIQEMGPPQESGF